MKCGIWSIDAWANPEGWDYNQKFLVGGVFLEEDCESEDIIEALYEGGFINTNDTDKVEVDTYFNGAMWCAEVKDAETGEPLYSIEEIDKLL